MHSDGKPEMLAQRLSNAGTSEPLFLWAERDSRARFILDDDLGVAWSNLAAADFLDDVDAFRVQDGTLTAESTRYRDAFGAFIRASTGQVSSMCVPCGDDDHVLCTCVNLINGGRPRATGLTLRRASSVVSVGVANLEAAFHLTAAERRVVETLFAGHTAEQIGSGLHMSVGTVRVHIRHIYEKLDVCSREAMFHKLLPFMLVR